MLRLRGPLARLAWPGRRALSLEVARIAKHGKPPSECYDEAADAGSLRRDPMQEAALVHLDRLHVKLQSYTHAPLPVDSGQAGSLRGWLSSTLGIGGGKSAEAEPPPPPLVRGLYMHGGVGCGKTFVMDLFFECSALPLEQKRRAHFHAFMLDVHKRMHALRKEPDPLGAVAAEIGSKLSLLCFDEFQVTDIADALVMKRLFSALFSAGTVVVATSNRPPGELYLNGLQRDLFVPFIDDLERCCEVHDLDSSTDYRMMQDSSLVARSYIFPLGPEADSMVRKLWKRLAKGDETADLYMTLRGRELHVPRASTHTAVARFTFEELCARPLGAEDYLALAAAFHTLFITDIPRMTEADVNRARRLITLIDALYERRVKVVVSAAAPPGELYTAGAESSDEAFAFNRTISRLTEMQSRDYLLAATRQAAMTHGIEQEAMLIFEQKQGLTDYQVRKLWDRYDIDGDGLVNPLELCLLLEDLRERASGHRNVLPEEVAAMMAKLDSDGSGTIEESEFFAYFSGRSMGRVAKRWLGRDPDSVTGAPRQS
mmetsp:Transcript_22206/g.56279  ORF Transcript_22206/g.56279 Transcript_22206/m.56279 type:complete len:543 (-) Transcript_22206:78-1706(-)